MVWDGLHVDVKGQKAQRYVSFGGVHERRSLVWRSLPMAPPGKLVPDPPLKFIEALKRFREDEDSELPMGGKQYYAWCLTWMMGGIKS